MAGKALVLFGLLKVAQVQSAPLHKVFDAPGEYGIVFMNGLLHEGCMFQEQLLEVVGAGEFRVRSGCRG